MRIAGALAARRLSPTVWHCGLATLLALASVQRACAVDFSVSGFGTLGYARSNESFEYQRFIDDDGTFKRDSVLGLQVDAKLTNEFAATVQLKGAAADGSDRRLEGSVSWAFLSYRPTNDWLFRAGKQRIPIYLYSENYDVGATYDFARLPTEMYSLLPSNDALGFSFSKSWKVGDGDLSLDGYFGTSHNDIRYWFRPTTPPVQDAGAVYEKLDFRGGGLVAAYKAADDTFRVGVHRANIRAHSGQPLPIGFPFVPIAPGVGYYQVSSDQSALPTVGSVTNTTIAIGADVSLPANVRVVGEFARSLVPHTYLAPKANRGYLALLRRIGKWTPYVTYAFLRSPQEQRDIYEQVNDNAVPLFIPGAPLINASQKAGADSILVYHQSSWAFGTSYSFSATSKLKAEFLRTRIGDVSKLVDSPSDGVFRDRSINVLSLSYSVVY